MAAGRCVGQLSQQRWKLMMIIQRFVFEMASEMNKLPYEYIMGAGRYVGRLQACLMWRYMMIIQGFVFEITICS